MANDSTNIWSNNRQCISNISKLIGDVYRSSSAYKARGRLNIYRDVILPLVFIRRLDLVLSQTKQKVRRAIGKESEKQEGTASLPDIAQMLEEITGEEFYNAASFSLEELLREKATQALKLREYIAGFSENVQDIITKFNFDAQIAALEEAGLLDQMIEELCGIDLHPQNVDSVEMSNFYERLISDSGLKREDQFLRPEVTELMLRLLFHDDDKAVRDDSDMGRILDPACGTGGILLAAQNYLEKITPKVSLAVFGQEVNGESNSVCKSRLILKGLDPSLNIMSGNALTEDGYRGETFEYLITNAGYNLDRNFAQNSLDRLEITQQIRAEHDMLSFIGRFGAGAFDLNDGSFLLLQHMIAKMKPPEEGGSRLVIIFEESQQNRYLETNVSEFQRWVIENDWLEAIVALPSHFSSWARGPRRYNSSAGSYIWVITNSKSNRRKGFVQLLNAHESLSESRYSTLSEERINRLTGSHRGFTDTEIDSRSKILSNKDIGFMRFLVEYPLRFYWEVKPEYIESFKKSVEFRNLRYKEHRGPYPSNEELRSDAGDICFQAISVLEGEKYSKQIDFERALAAKASDEWEQLGYPTVKVNLNKNPFGDVMEPAPLSPAEVFNILNKFRYKDPTAPDITDPSGEKVSDPDLNSLVYLGLPDCDIRYGYTIPEDLKQAYSEVANKYLKDEVNSHHPDSWIDNDNIEVIYEILFTKYFHIPALIPDYSSISEMISNGENQWIEFKETLLAERNINGDGTWKERTDWKFKILRQIAAFLNSEGGHILIGVADNRSIYGIEPDFTILKGSKENTDKFSQCLSALKDDAFTKGSAGLVKIEQIVPMEENKHVAWVRVEPSDYPVCVEKPEGNGKPKTNVFFVRDDSRVVPFQPSEAEKDKEEMVKYIKRRWTGLSDSEIEKFISDNWPNLEKS